MQASYLLRGAILQKKPYTVLSGNQHSSDDSGRGTTSQKFQLQKSSLIIAYVPSFLWGEKQISKLVIKNAIIFLKASNA